MTIEALPLFAINDAMLIGLLLIVALVAWIMTNPIEPKSRDAWFADLKTKWPPYKEAPPVFAARLNTTTEAHNLTISPASILHIQVEGVSFAIFDGLFGSMRVGFANSPYTPIHMAHPSHMAYFNTPEGIL